MVFLRHFLISAILASAYYINLKTFKTQFIRRCLHEMNERSIGEVLDQVDEPILVIKQKHKVNMKPKYMNRAAKELL